MDEYLATVRSTAFQSIPYGAAGVGLSSRTILKPFHLQSAYVSKSAARLSAIVSELAGAYWERGWVVRAPMGAMLAGQHSLLRGPLSLPRASLLRPSWPGRRRPVLGDPAEQVHRPEADVRPG